MKRIITLLLIAIMLITTTVSVFAGAPPSNALTLSEFRDVLIGNGLADTAIGAPKMMDGSLGLQTVYKNISPDQIAKFRAFNTALNTFSDTADYSQLVCAGVVADDVKVLVKGIAQIMTFVTEQYKDHLDSDTSAEVKKAKLLADINTVSLKFYGYTNEPTDPTTAKPQPGSPAYVLNNMSNNTLTKNAFGGVVYVLKKEVRKIISNEIATFPGTFVKNTSNGFLNDPNAIKDLMKNALASIFTNADSRTQLYQLKQGLKNTDMLSLTGETVLENSKIITVVEKAFDLMNAVDGDYDTAATVANINLAGVLDAQLVNPSNATDVIANPNYSIAFTPTKNSVTFKVRPRYTTSSFLENLHLIQQVDVTDWLDCAVYSGPLDAQVDKTLDFNITYNSNATITISPKSGIQIPNYYVLKLYRRVYATPGSLDPNEDEIKDLFIEIPMSYKADSDTPNPPGSGGGTTVGKKFTVNTKVSGTSGTGTEEGGTTVVTNSNGETGTFTEGTTVKIVATPKPGFKFAGWSHDGVVISTDPEYTFVLGKDIDFVAVFVKDDQLERVSHNWYLRGYPDGSFNADRNLTRAEMAMVLYRISSDAQRQNTIPENAFSDVKASEWYTKAITFLKNKNILNGYENGEFRPNAPVTRAEMATMVSRYDSLKSDSNNPFNDVSNEHWAYNYIISASVNNWIKGYPDSSFKPNGYATRAETATLVNRVLDRKIEVADISKADTMQYTDLLDSHWGYAAIMEATHTHKYTRKENFFELWTEIVKPYAGFND
jgi:hypothetical protein